MSNMRLKRLCRLLTAVLVFVLFAVWSFIATRPEEMEAPFAHLQGKGIELDEKPKSGKRDLNSNLNNVPRKQAQPLDNSFIFSKKEAENIPHVYSENVKNRTKIDIRKPKDTEIHVNISSNLKGPNEYIKQAILEVNHEQRILNLDRFPKRSKDSIVILVMVHKRLEYLQYLISSLSRATNIGDALLVFSHDYYSEDINKVIRAIDFCQVSIVKFGIILPGEKIKAI